MRQPLGRYITWEIPMPARVTPAAMVHYCKALIIQTAQLGRHNPQTLESFRKLDYHMRKPEE